MCHALDGLWVIPSSCRGGNNLPTCLQQPRAREHQAICLYIYAQATRVHVAYSLVLDLGLLRRWRRLHSKELLSGGAPLCFGLLRRDGPGGRRRCRRARIRGLFVWCVGGDLRLRGLVAAGTGASGGKIREILRALTAGKLMRVLVQGIRRVRFELCLTAESKANPFTSDI